MSTLSDEEIGQTSLDRWRDLVLSDERRELVETARRQVASRFPLDVIRQAFDNGAQPAGAWDVVAAAEYQLIGLPEEHGGIGSMIDLAALLEACGRELLPAPLLATVMASHTLLAAGLPLGGAGSRPSALAVSNQPWQGSAVTLTGLVVLDATLAERLVVVMPSDQGVAIATLDPESSSSGRTMSHVDPSRPVEVVDITVEVTDVNDVAVHLDDLLASARIALAADLTGVATGALDRAVRHAVEREQFGRSIGAFQGIKHRLADVYVATKRARSLTRAAAVVSADVGAGQAEVRELSLLAKAAATDAAIDSSRAFVQVLGAMGMTFEADAHLYFRRAQQTAPFLGSAAECYRSAALHRRGAAS